MAENILSTKVPEIIKYNVVLLLLNASESGLKECLKLYSLLTSINIIFRNAHKSLYVKFCALHYNLLETVN